MSDSDFSDVDDAIVPSAPSMTSCVTLRAIPVVDASSSSSYAPQRALFARLGGPIYPWLQVPHDAAVSIFRRGNVKKPVAADSRREPHLEIVSVEKGEAPSEDSGSAVLVDVLAEEEPFTSVVRSSANGKTAVKFAWVVGEKPDHPTVRQVLIPPAPSAVQLQATDAAPLQATPPQQPPPPTPVFVVAPVVPAAPPSQASVQVSLTAESKSPLQPQQSPLTRTDVIRHASAPTTPPPLPLRSEEPRGNEATLSVSVYVAGCSNVLTRDTVTKSDPYVKLFRSDLRQHTRTLIFQTLAIQDNNNPTWPKNERTSAVINMNVTKGMPDEEYVLEVWDDDSPLSDEFLGQAILTYQSVIDGPVGRRTLALRPRPGETDADIVRNSDKLGSISIELDFVPPPLQKQSAPSFHQPITVAELSTGEFQSAAPPPLAPSSDTLYLHAEIVKVSNIKVFDPTTYARVTISSNVDPNNTLIQATHVVKRSSNPVFHVSTAMPLALPCSAVTAPGTMITCYLQVFEKKLISTTGDAVLAEGKVQIPAASLLKTASEVVDVAVALGASDATVGLVRFRAFSDTPNLGMSTKRQLLCSNSETDGIAVLQLEIVRAELKKEECPPGVFFAQYTIRSGKHNEEIQTANTVAILADKSAPLWLHSTQLQMKYQEAQLDFSIVRKNSLKNTEDVSAVAPYFIIEFSPASAWVSTVVELQLPTDEAAKKEKSNDAGLLHIRYRTISQRRLEAENIAKRQRYLVPLLADSEHSNNNEHQQQDRRSKEDDDCITAAPKLLSRFSLKLSVEACDSLLLSTPKDRFADAQIVVLYSGSKDAQSNVIPLSGADDLQLRDPQFHLELQTEPEFAVQQFVVRVIVPSSAGGGSRVKTLGVGICDIDILSLQSGAPTRFPVVLEARTGGDDKDLADDVALLNRAGRVNFGTVVLSAVLQRLDYWSNASVLNVVQLKLKEQSQSGSPSYVVSSQPSRCLALWFRQHHDFTIPIQSVHYVPLDANGSMSGALQIPTTFPMDARGRLAPLCVAIIRSDALAADLESLSLTLTSFLTAVEKRIFEKEGLGARSIDELREFVFTSACQAIMTSVANYIEFDLTSFLIEASCASEAGFSEGIPRGSTTFCGTLPFSAADKAQNAHDSYGDELFIQGNWMCIAQHLRQSSVLGVRKHGFDAPSERVWIVRCRTILPGGDPAGRSAVEDGDAARQQHTVKKCSSSNTQRSRYVVQVVAREVVVPEPPGFSPVVCSHEVPFEVPDDLTEDFHASAFVFGPAHSSRTDIVLTHSAAPDAAAVLKLDMLLRSGSSTISLKECAAVMNIDWIHGNLGISESEERERRRSRETEWRLSQKEPPHKSLVVTFMGRAEDVEPPRLCGSSLTRCGSSNTAILVGGLDETSRPLSSIFQYHCKEKKWTDWKPKKVARWSGVTSTPLHQQNFAVRMSDMADASYSRRDDSKKEESALIFSARHGHSACYSSTHNSVIVYGGIGVNGFDPASVGEDGYIAQPRRPSSSRRRPSPRNGYLSDVWLLDVKKDSLLCASTATAETSNSLTHDHCDLRWRHTAEWYSARNSMFVFGGKTLLVKSVTVPQYNNPQPTSSKSKQPTDTTYFVAEETLCGLDCVSVLSFDTMKWSVEHTSGVVPASRYGHGTVAHEKKVYLWGGRGTADLYNDLHVLDLDTLMWAEILPFGTMVPRPTELFSMCHVIVDQQPLLVVAGGKSNSDSANEKFLVYYFNIGTQFWHSLTFSCSSGQRRIMPAMCDATPTAVQRPLTSSLKRLPYEFKSILQLLVVGGERGIPVGLDELSGDVPPAALVAKEESEYFDGGSIHPRPSAQPCLLNIAADPGENILYASGARNASKVEDDVLCPHFRFRDTTIPGWALEKSVNRLATKPQPPPPQTKSLVKSRPPLTSEEQKHHIEKMDMHLENRRKNREQLMQDAYDEVLALSSKTAKAPPKKWEDDEWVRHYYRVFYRPAMKYAKSRNLPEPKLPAQLQSAILELQDEDRARELEESKYRASNNNTSVEEEAPTARCLRGEEIKEANERLYYAPVAAKKAAAIEVHDSLRRPQSAQRVVTQLQISESINRLHRGPPSPLSSAKYGPRGRSAYTPTGKRSQK